MFLPLWTVIIAVWFPFLSPQSGQPKPSTDGNARQEQHASPHENPVLVEQPTPKATATDQGCQNAGNRADKNKYPTEYDARLWGLIINGVLALLGVAYGYFAFTQSRALRDQLKIAQDQIELIKRDQRAWVTVADIAFDEPLAIGETPRVSIELKNSGKSPALNVTFGSSLRMRNEIGEFNVDETIIGGVPSRAIVAPGASIHAPLDCDEPIANTFRLNQLRLCQRILVVWCRIEYEDTFGKLHSTTSCHWWGGLKNDMFLAADIGNEAN